MLLIEFLSILSRSFSSIFIKGIGYYTFPVVSLSGLGVREMPVSSNEEEVSPSILFCKSLRYFGVNSFSVFVRVLQLFFFLFLLSLDDMFLLLFLSKEKERKRKVEREDFHWWKSCMCRDRRMNSQPRYVPWPGMEPTSLQIAVTSCKDGTEVKFSSVTYFRKLPSCYYWNIHLHPLWMIRWRFRVRWFCNSSSKLYLKYLCTVFLERAECSMCHWSNS